MKIRTICVRSNVGCYQPHTFRGSHEAAELLVRINDYRMRHDLRPLIWSPPLAQAAQYHSEAMGRWGFFDHRDPQGRGPAERVRAAGYGPYLIVGENIAAGQRTPAEAVTAWIGSPSHHALLVNRIITQAGVGLAEAAGQRFWTLNCARPLPIPGTLADFVHPRRA